MILKDGDPTGLFDDHGRPICVGAFVKKPVTCNTDLHGEWAVYQVVLRGIVPILSYMRSQTGRKLPVGYIAAPLSDEYDQKLLLFVSDMKDLRPMNSLEAVPQ
ncbi:MAG: hypothetical protein R3B90_21845 [Planctomycetaceae bacterium]